MDENIFIAVTCIISPGAFSGERVFRVKLANSDFYVGISPREFCWNDHGLLVEKNEPEYGSEIEGKIAARLLRTIDNDQIIVEVPDGQSIVVDSQTIVKRPTRITVNSAVENSYVLV
jgi:hypothetical protein